MGSDKEKARIRRKNNFVKKHMDKIHVPKTIEPEVEYKRRPKKIKPVHEIDPHDEYIDEHDIWRD